MGREIKNIIILKNVHSNVFEEIIFILKSDINQNELKNKNLVFEARRIVEDYVNGNNYYFEQPPPEMNYKYRDFKGGDKISTILNISLVLSFILFVLLLIRVFE